jgi:F-type H+-transporting ATPase subunit delta
MANTNISSYAKALYDLSKEGDQGIYYETATTILNLIYENPGMLKYISDVSVDIEERKDLMKQMTENADNNFTNFHYLLLDIGKGNILMMVLKSFIDLVNKDLGIIQGKVITTIKLKKIETKMSKKLNLKVSLMPEIDNEILGGIIVKINNQV